MDSQHDRVRDGGLKIESKHGTSLLKTAIQEKCAEVAKFLLAKGARIKFDPSILRDVIMQENKEFAGLLVRYTEDTKDLIVQLRGSAVMARSESRKETKETVLFHELIKKMPDIAEEALYRSVSFFENGEIDYGYTKSLLLNEWKEDADINLAESLHGIEMGDVNHENDPGKMPSDTEMVEVHESTLNCMVEHRVLKLLQHPGVKHVLEEKWHRLGLPLYMFQLFLYCLLVIPLSISVLLPNLSAEASYVYRISAYSLAGYILVASLLHLLFLIVIIFRRLCRNKKNVDRIFFPIIKQFHIYLQVVAFGLDIVFSVLTIANIATDGCCAGVTWHFGLLAIILGWTFLIHLCSKLPFVGEQAIAFLEIVWTFLKLTIFALLLVLAATIILSMTFFNSEAFDSPFYTFRRGIVTVTTMITGELDYSDAFGLSYESSNNKTVEIPTLLYPETANFVWVIFLIFIPILLSNMLTGLAVGDVIEIQRNAAVRKLAHQVKLVENAEYFLGNRKSGCMECFNSVYTKLEELIINDNAREEDIVKEKFLSYKKKRDAEIKEIREKGHFHKDNRTIESIEDVKEVAISIEKKIKEFKDSYDDTVKVMKEDNDNVRRDLEQLQKTVKLLASRALLQCIASK